jgi:hypothetical protein
MVPDTILKVKISIPKNSDLQYPLLDRFALPAPVMNPAGPESALGIQWSCLPFFHLFKLILLKIQIIGILYRLGNNASQS